MSTSVQMFFLSQSGKQIGRLPISNLSLLNIGECGPYPGEQPANFSTLLHINSKYEIMGPNLKWHWRAEMLECRILAKEYGANFCSSRARHDTRASGQNQVNRGLSVKAHL